MGKKPLYYASGEGFSIPSKKNTLASRKGGGFYNRKSKEMEAITWHLKAGKPKYPAGSFPITIPVSIEFNITDTNRADYNNQLTTVCDCLESAGVIKNDRLIKGFKESCKTIKRKGEKVHFSVALYKLES